MRFTISEYMSRSKKSGCVSSDFTMAVMQNASDLLDRINALGYRPPMYFSSCLRSKAKQIAIYNAKGITDINKIPLGSSHLNGKAVDIVDTDGRFGKWLLEHEDKLVEQGLYCEDYDSTHTKNSGWVHLQSTPTKKRFFLP